MHALITGVGGFIGSRVAGAFLEAGWRVTGICRKRPPTRLSAQSCLDIVTTDLRRCEGLPDHYDCLVHCAAEVPAYCPDEEELYRSNVEGTQRLLAHAMDAGARRVTYMSSMAVYGTISVAVVDEKTAPVAPDVYGRSKAEGERLVAEWSLRTGGSSVSIRLPGIVGAGGRNNFMCDTLQRILADQPVAARDPDALFNNIVHVDDLAAFVLALAERTHEESTILTIAAREPLTIRDALARLCRRAGRKEQINWTAGGGSPFLIAFERACALGYRPATVEESIDRYVADVLAESNRH